MIPTNPIIPFIVDSTAGVPWADGSTVRLPASIVESLRAGLPIDKDAVSQLRILRAYTDQAPTSSRLPIRYIFIPSWIRSLVGKAIGRGKRRSVDQWAAFPAWPIDLSADFLADAAGIHSTFADGPTPVMLSHDLDSPEGLQNLHRHFLDIEEAAGARSTNYIVPCDWKIDHALLGEVAARGHEIGVHGFNHGNQTPFLDETQRRNRLYAAKGLIERYQISGYRAPSLLRTRALIADLKLLYRYDSSIPTTGGLFPVPNNGCASARPFMIEGILEIPVSMPRDGSLGFLGYRPEEILALWIECANRIAASGGVVMLLTHCEKRFSGNVVMLDVYKRFLDYIACSPKFVWSSPAAILAKFQEQLNDN